MRNVRVMTVWFAAWTGDIQRAREAYELREAELDLFLEMAEQGRIPARCRSGRHTLSDNTVSWSKDGRWRCIECRNIWQQKQWRRAHPQARRVGPKKKLNRAKQREVAQRYSAGALTRDLVAEYNVSKPTILRAVREAGVQVRSRKESARAAQPRGESPQLTVEQRLQVVAMYKNLESSSDIAKRFGVSPMTVLRTIRNAGVPARTRSESMKISHANRRPTGRTA